MVEPKKVILPPRHINVGSIKQCGKKLHREEDAFKYIQKFLEAKVKAGVFVAPKVKRFVEFDSFSEKLSAA